MLDQRDQNPNLHRRPIQYNFPVSSDYRQHTNIWDYRNTEPGMREWMSLLGPGDVLQVFPKAKFPGWVNYVKLVEVDLYCETDGVLSELANVS